MDELASLLKGSSVSSEDVVLDSVVKEDKFKDSFLPRVKQNIAYIVCSVLLNDSNETLMVQEAKQSCRGKWYLPAGRMERNETIEVAAKRELLEEAGLTCDYTSLICVEATGCNWIRFSLTGTVTGGTLKALNPTDKETLQAKWFDVDKVKSGLDLRSTDVFPLISEAVRRRSSSTMLCSVRPINCAHKKMLLRLVLLQTVGEKHERQVLVGLRSRAHLPTVVFHSVDGTTRNFLETIFKTPVEWRILGVVSVEHNGQPADTHDGCCLTLLVTLDGAAVIADEALYQWSTVTDSDLISHLNDLSVGAVTLRC